jgi:acetyl-CoA carboxylase carboxyl transferase subunit beta
MSWFKRNPTEGDKKLRSEEGERTVRTEGLWQKCENCREIIWKKDLDATNNVCPKCDQHFRIEALSRLALLFDDGVFEQCDVGLSSSDPLKFVDNKPYSERLAAMQAATNLDDALVSAVGNLAGRRVRICAMEPKFIGGSMGSVMGEKITRSIEACIAEMTPMIIVSASGGARMQEGAVSLMQMAKISSALMRLDEAGVPYISILTDPTTGGVTASLAMLGDLNIAEPGALIGFAGPRVIEQTIRQKLPDGFQRSEFLLKHGMLDAVVPRAELKTYVAGALNFFCGPATRSADKSDVKPTDKTAAAALTKTEHAPIARPEAIPVSKRIPRRA